MKFFSFIFSIYIAVLSCMPCDEGEIFSNSKISVEKTMQADNHQHSGETCDACSPFCTCSCCQTFFFFQQGSEIKVAENFSVYTEENISSIIDISIPVWQPPKIS